MKKRKTRKDLPLGRLARDTISGFEGIIDSRTEWLNGCFRIGLAPDHLDKDGKLIQAVVFDSEQILVLPLQHHVEKPKKHRTNGPMPDPMRQGD